MSHTTRPTNTPLPHATRTRPTPAPDREPQIWLRDLCHVCHTALRRAHPDPFGPRVCSTCLRIDHTLARAHDAVLLTPLDPAWARGDRVLLHRLFPTIERGSAHLADHHTREVLRTLRSLDPADQWGLAPRWPGAQDHARVIDLDRWQAHVPPGPHASADGYRRYVEALHPWLPDVEPRVTDVGHLARCALAG